MCGSGEDSVGQNQAHILPSLHYTAHEHDKNLDDEDVEEERDKNLDDDEEDTVPSFVLPAQSSISSNEASVSVGDEAPGISGF